MRNGPQTHLWPPIPGNRNLQDTSAELESIAIVWVMGSHFSHTGWLVLYPGSNRKLMKTEKKKKMKRKGISTKWYAPDIVFCQMVPPWQGLMAGRYFPSSAMVKKSAILCRYLLAMVWSGMGKPPGLAILAMRRKRIECVMKAFHNSSGYLVFVRWAVFILSFILSWFMV